MSGFSCTFFDSCNSISSNPCHNSSKPFRILTPIHLPHNPFSTIIIRRSRRRKGTNSRDSLQISALPQSFQLIQTSVHYDGSLIFQFGYPSETIENDERVEYLESECEEGSHAVKDVGGDHEKEVITDIIESEERSESDFSSSDDASQSVNGVDIGNSVIESASNVEKVLSNSLLESCECDSVIKDLEGGCEDESYTAQVLDVDHEKQVTTTTLIEETRESDELAEDLESEVEEISSDDNVDEDHEKDELDMIIELTDSQTSSSTDVNETQVESSESDELVEELESEGDEISNNANIDEDLKKHELDKTLEIEEATESDTSNFNDASDSSNEVDIEITVSERENDLTDSREDLNERLVKNFRDGEVPSPLSVSVSVSLSVSVSVSETKINDFVSSGHSLENAEDKGKFSDEEDGNASLSPFELEVPADSFSIGKKIEDSKEFIEVITKSESPSSKIEPIIEDLGVMPLSEKKIEVDDSRNEADVDISVVERVSDVVGDLIDSQPEPSEMPLVLSDEVGGLVSDSEVTTHNHFNTVGIMEEDYVLDLDISNPINESPLFEFENLKISDPITEEVNLSEDQDLNIVSELPLSKSIDMGEIDIEVETPLVQGFKAEMVLDDGVDRDALEEFSQADDVESPMLGNQDISNSLVGAERTKVEEQRNELSEVLIVEAIQLESTQTDLKREISTTAFALFSGAAALTHPSKALTGGEDAYFLSCSNWLGVADGISQWSLEGIDRGIYAHELMKNCKIIVSDNGSTAMVKPIEVLSRSVKETQSSGSSTVLVAYFDGQALHVVNIGDTGFMIIRHGVVYKKSAPMFHEFNFPVHIQRGDDPLQFLEEYVIDLDEGDTIITATDGLFDNLYEQEIASIVSKSLQASMKPEEIARVLATRAQEGGKSGGARSPFADAAKAAGYTGFTGGKLDDVAVIVSLVNNRSNSHV